MSLTASQKSRLIAFLVGGAVLIALFISVPLGFGLAHRQKHYFCYFEGESVSGLEEGATIKFRGIPIGKVDRISYEPQRLERVKVDFLVQHDFPLKSDMYVQTGMVGITGLKYVEISGGTDTTKILPPGSQVESRPSMMASITGKTDVIIAKIELLLNHLNTITDPANLGSINRILDNVADISAKTERFVDDVAPEIHSVAKTASHSMQTIDGIAGDVKILTGNLNQNIDARRLGAILASVDSTSRAMKRLSETLNLTIRQTQEDFSISVENLKETLINANELSKTLTENPSLLIRGGDQQKEREMP